MFSRLRSFLTAWTGRERFEDSLDEEVRFHLDTYAEDLVRSGVPRREALRRARIHFGSVEGMKDNCRQARGLRLADEIARDMKHAGRFLRRNPGFAGVAIATLGLSIGATVLVFSLIDAWLFRPLNFPEPDRLTISVYATRERPSEPAVFVLYRDYLSWKDRSRSFESMAAVFPRTYLMGDVADIGTAEGLVVTGEFFRTLGGSPRLGRTFSHGDETGAAVTVLSHGLWERRFGASETVIGTSVTLNDVPHEVIGVMPPEFELRMLDQATGFELWTLFRPGEPGYTPGGTGGVAVLGRLRSAKSIAAAQQELTGIHRDSESVYARNAADFDVLVASLQADNTRTVRLTLVIVAGAVGCLLLIACMNIAALWLGRAPGRTREAAVRVALGAGRMRLIGQSLAESLLLACIGGACGLGLAMVAVRLFTAWNPLGVLPAAPIGIDVRSLVFAGVVTGAAALMSGIAPALRAAATDPNEALRTGGERGSSTTFGCWRQPGMLAAQVAASVVLLVAVVLLVRSFGRLQDEPLGFDVSNITVASLALPTAEFDSGDHRHAFFERLAERLGTLPGVRRTTASTAPLLSSGVPALVQTRASDDETALRVPVQDVTLGYFATLGIPLSAGRLFDVRDGPDAPPVAVLNESAARLLFGSPADALGRRIRIADDTSREVAGVVGDTRSAFFNTLEWVTNPVIYLPARQAFDAIRDPTLRSFALHLQIESGTPLSMAEVRRAMAGRSTRVVVTQTRPAADVVAAALRQPAFRMWLLGWFAVVSLVLAAIGVYGSVSQGIAHRTREIGICLALGAAPCRVRVAVTSRTLLTVALGAIGGCAAAMVLGAALEAVLYGVRPGDLGSFTAALAALLTVTTGAAFAAALRATRISP
ncbi:MAG: ADOP family duplicated permease, partial [Acidobacteria bacterium]|nr:ADOP family duplicated permease [Acidobacteriota bacterium]